jgi:hypothetical protein
MAVTLKMTSWEQKRKSEKSRKPRFYGQKNFFLSTMSFSPWVDSATFSYRSSSKNIGKMDLKSILNKTSPWAHMESKFDVLGVPGKLVKYIVHLSKKKIEKKLLFFIQAAQTPID